MSNLSAFLGIILSLLSIAGIVLAIYEYFRKPHTRREHIIRVSLIGAVLVPLVILGGFISTSTNVSVHPPKLPFVPNATVPPTATPIPTSTPIPVPTPKVIPENLNIACLNCNGNMAYSLKLDSIEIDYTNQQTTVKFTIIDIGSWSCDVVFDKLEFQDDSGTIFKAQNVGQTLGNLATGNPLIVNSIFNLRPQPNIHYLLSTTLHCSYNGIDYKTQDFVFN